MIAPDRSTLDCTAMTATVQSQTKTTARGTNKPQTKPKQACVKIIQNPNNKPETKKMNNQTNTWQRTLVALVAVMPAAQRGESSDGCPQTGMQQQRLPLVWYLEQGLQAVVVK